MLVFCIEYHICAYEIKLLPQRSSRFSGLSCHPKSFWSN